MNWFRKNLSCCAACGNIFDPSKVESCEPWDHLCYEHRKPHIDMERRRKMVVEWANRNWLKLEEQATKEVSAQQAGLQQRYQGMRGAGNTDWRGP